MNEFVVRKDSWHYRFLVWYRTTVNAFDDRRSKPERYSDFYLEPSDFCAYWRAVLLWPLVRFGFNIVLVAAIIGFIVASIGQGLVSLWLVAFALAVLAAAAAVIGIGWAVMAGGAPILEVAAGAVSRATKSDLATTAYQAYRDKFCPYLVYKKEE